MEDENVYESSLDDIISVQLDSFAKNAAVIGISNENLQMFLQALRAGSMREISLNGSTSGLRLNDESLGKLVLCIQQSGIPIESLALTYHSFTDDGVESIRDYLLNPAAGQASTLEHLNLEGNSISVRGMKYLQLNSTEACPLLSLNLSGNPIGERGGLAISEALLSNRRIRSLKLNNCGFSLTGIVAIAASMASGGRDIMELQIDRPILPRYVPGNESCDHFSRILGSARNLVALSLKFHNIGDEGARVLAYNLNKATQLVSLNLECNKIGVAGAEALASFLIIQAREQSAARRPQSSIGGKSSRVASVGLQHLLLSYNAVGNQGAIALAEAISNSSCLSTLTLKNNGISDEGLVAIRSALDANNTLRALHLFGNDFLRSETGRQYHDLIENRLPYIDLQLDIKTYISDGLYLIAEQN